MIDERTIVEKLDVKEGDVVLVIVPEGTDHREMTEIADAFAWLGDEIGAHPFVVTDSLRFKVVRAEEAP